MTRSTESQKRLQLVPTSAPSEDTRPSQPVPKAGDAGLEDAQLVACVRVDPSCARLFYDRVRPRIDVTVRSLLGAGDPEHEDLVQRTMIALVEGIGRYRGDCSLGSWASLIAARVVYKEIRRRRRARRVFDSEVLDAEDCASPTNSSNALIARDLAARVRRHLGRIHEDKAWTFLLHDVCGFTLDEIANITDVSVAAAQKRLARGREELFELMAADRELADLVRARESRQ